MMLCAKFGWTNKNVICLRRKQRRRRRTTDKVRSEKLICAFNSGELKQIVPFVDLDTSTVKSYRSFTWKLVLLQLIMNYQILVFFVCLFAWGFSSLSRIFHSNGDVTITGEGLQILTYARHLIMAIEQWGFFSVPLLHVTRGIRNNVIISEDPWHSHLLPSVWQCSCHYLFLWLFTFCRGWESISQPSACGANALTDCVILLSFIII